MALIKETTQELMCDKEQMTKVQVMMSRFYSQLREALPSQSYWGEIIYEGTFRDLLFHKLSKYYIINQYVRLLSYNMKLRNA